MLSVKLIDDDVLDRILECYSIMLNIQDPQTAKSDAMYLMEVLDAKNMDLSGKYLLTAYARIAQNLKQEFAPCVEKLWSKLIENATVGTEQLVLANPGDEEDEPSVSVNQEAMEIRNESLLLLAMIAQHCPSSISTSLHVEQLLKAITAALERYIDAEQAKTACDIIPAITSICVKEGLPVDPLLNLLLQNVSAILASYDMSLTAILLDDLSDMMKQLPPNSITAQHIKLLHPDLLRLVRHLFSESTAAAAAVKDEEDEDDAAVDENDANDCRDSVCAFQTFTI